MDVDKVFNKYFDDAKSSANELASKAKGAAQSVQKQVSEKVESIKPTLDQQINTAKKSGEDVASSAKKFGEAAWNYSANTASNVASKTSSVVQDGVGRIGKQIPSISTSIYNSGRRQMTRWMIGGGLMFIAGCFAFGFGKALPGEVGRMVRGPPPKQPSQDNHRDQ
eukprot:TRINITY_DN9656_c1_g1_i1.p1 TRINITY_DN9656_c1_g1~~TRINITY_DN9656_c1_g1_i1.p1  ORF type:complete len:166 (-),score=30.94 TRINITY_DN9656_c1_g1_i1:85-582(-)